MDWIDSIHRALSYIEEHLDGDISPEDVAREAAFSRFYLERVFSVVAGISLSEYVRGRRMTRAGEDLLSGDKVIDVALRYGYAPESFQKTFRKFHGVTPRDVRLPGKTLRSMNPMSLKIELTGGNIMDYTIEKLEPLSVIGREYRVPEDTAFSVVPALWSEYAESGMAKLCPGCLGICLDDGAGAEFTYMIGCFAGCIGGNVPDGFVNRTLPGGLWAKFKTRGAMPGAIQSLNRLIYTEWLPGNGKYEWGEPVNVEVYSEGDMDSPAYESEIWLPVREKK